MCVSRSTVLPVSAGKLVSGVEWGKQGTMFCSECSSGYDLGPGYWEDSKWSPWHPDTEVRLTRIDLVDHPEVSAGIAGDEAGVSEIEAI